MRAVERVCFSRITVHCQRRATSSSDSPRPYIPEENTNLVTLHSQCTYIHSSFQTKCKQSIRIRYTSGVQSSNCPTDISSTRCGPVQLCCTNICSAETASWKCRSCWSSSLIKHGSLSTGKPESKNNDYDPFFTIQKSAMWLTN